MVGEAIAAVILLGVGALIGPWVQRFMERMMGHQFDKRMEDYRYAVRTREQAAKAAEYLALTWRLEAEHSDDVYRRANQVGWELAMYLPPDVYRHVRDALAAPSKDRNICSAVICVREHLLGPRAGNLESDDVAIHLPNAQKALGG